MSLGQYVIYNTVTEQYLARNLDGDDDALKLFDGAGVSWVDEVLGDNWCVLFSEECINDQYVLAQNLIELGIDEVDRNLEFIRLGSDGVNFVGEKIRLTDILIGSKNIYRR